MALTKVTKSGITNNAIDADKIEDGTILDTDITPGTITNAKLAGSIANAKLANSSLTINGSSVSLGSSISAGALDWQAVITADGSTGTTGVAGRGYFIDTTSAAHTFTLPGSPTIGATIAIVDYAGTFATNKLTIARNGNNIQGVANNSLLGTNRASITLVYVDATKGWVYANESNVADLQEALFITATGGTVTTSGNFKIHTFTGDGSFVVSSLSNPVGGPNSVDYLVVAGGGGTGPAHWAGGGGAGGFRESKDTTINSPHTASPLAATTGITVTTTSYPITVGAGGVGGSGSNSVFSTITSAGGGFGGSPGPEGTNLGNAGGSGAGGSPFNSSHPTTEPGKAGNTPPVSPSQGNPGGYGYRWNSGFAAASGGGGGAGGSGGNSLPYPGPFCGEAGIGGNGGNGATTSITGSPVTYAGGGAGTSYQQGKGGTGGPGGGGNGGVYNPAAPFSAAPKTSTSGAANTGGGGGGDHDFAGPTGGKGIVILRYKYQ